MGTTLSVTESPTSLAPLPKLYLEFNDAKRAALAPTAPPPVETGIQASKIKFVSAPGESPGANPLPKLQSNPAYAPKNSNTPLNQFVEPPPGSSITPPKTAPSVATPPKAIPKPNPAGAAALGVGIGFAFDLSSRLAAGQSLKVAANGAGFTTAGSIAGGAVGSAFGPAGTFVGSIAGGAVAGTVYDNLLIPKLAPAPQYQNQAPEPEYADGQAAGARYQLNIITKKTRADGSVETTYDNRWWHGPIRGFRYRDYEFFGPKTEAWLKHGTAQGGEIESYYGAWDKGKASWTIQSIHRLDQERDESPYPQPKKNPRSVPLPALGPQPTPSPVPTPTPVPTAAPAPEASPLELQPKLKPKEQPKPGALPDFLELPKTLEFLNPLSLIPALAPLPKPSLAPAPQLQPQPKARLSPDGGQILEPEFLDQQKAEAKNKATPYNPDFSNPATQCQTDPCLATIQQKQQVHEGKLDAAASKQDQLLQKLDALGQAVDLALLAEINGRTKTIDAKLGPQIPNGGIGGKLLEFFEGFKKFTNQLWDALGLDKAIQLLTLATSVHNAAMLSRDLAGTLVEVTESVIRGVSLFIPGFLRNPDGTPMELNLDDLFKQKIESFLKATLGEATYKDLSAKWKYANRILTVTSNMLDATRSMLDAATQGISTVGGWVAKIGNGMQNEGIVSDDTWPWMDEKPNFGRFGAIGRYVNQLENLEDALDTVNQLAQAPIEYQQGAIELTKERQELAKILSEKETEKKTAEDAKSTASQSPEIDAKSLLPAEDN